MDKSFVDGKKQRDLPKKNRRGSKKDSNKTELDKDISQRIDELAKMWRSSSIKPKRVGDGLVLKGFTNEPHVMVAKHNLETVSGNRIAYTIITKTDVTNLLGEFDNKVVTRFNSFVAMSALVRVDTGTLLLANRLTVYEGDDNAWKLFKTMLHFAAISQGDFIERLSMFFRQLMNPFGSKTPLVMPKGDEPSLWVAEDFIFTEKLMTQAGYVANADENGLTVEFPWEKGAHSAAAAHQTSLLMLDTLEPNPLYGNGLGFRFMPPVHCEEEKLTGLCIELNLWELNGLDMPPFFGAWCPDKNLGVPCFQGFWPNLAYYPGCAVNLCAWMSARNNYCRAFTSRI